MRTFSQNDCRWCVKKLSVLMLQFREIMFINKKKKRSDFQMLYKTIKKNLFTDYYGKVVYEGNGF